MPYSKYAPERMGKAAISPTGAFEAGTHAPFTLTYTAGHFGIDDRGGLKIVHRFASDLGRLQLNDPEGANYVTAEASNGALLHLTFDNNQNVRPWDKTLYIEVVQGFLREGDEIAVRLGDTRFGGPGLRLQTFCEKAFEFRFLVDAFASHEFVELPENPAIAIVAGTPRQMHAVAPTHVAVGEPFALNLRTDDAWGNPSEQSAGTLYLHCDTPIEGLPDTVTFTDQEAIIRVEGLKVASAGDFVIEVQDDHGDTFCKTNPIRARARFAHRGFWADLHGQSEETVGTNSAEDYFTFARDKAFLDACAHQGNDFQITGGFWTELNQLAKTFTEPGRFIAFPGFAWSGNTAVGGDRNVLFAGEGELLRRSSHALVPDLADTYTDVTTAKDLFRALSGIDCTVTAHVGGRYADLGYAHDPLLERSVEVHSSWGTFDWLLMDAFRAGARVGIVANSDGRDGRPGNSNPGAMAFGSHGGLTCLLAAELTRPALMDALKRRHHYATTGCRAVLDTRLRLDAPARQFDQDPAGRNPQPDREITEAIMGDILQTDQTHGIFRIDLHSPAPIERVEFRNATRTLGTWRPTPDKEDRGRRIRVIWEGSEMRGRNRNVRWDGFAQLAGNRFERIQPLDHMAHERRMQQTEADRVEWESITTGGFSGFDAWLEDPAQGWLRLEAGDFSASVQVADIGRQDMVLEAGGLDKRVRLFRLPGAMTQRRIRLERRVRFSKTRDDAIYVRATLEDGHVIWSSPIYVLPAEG